MTPVLLAPVPKGHSTLIRSPQPALSPVAAHTDPPAAALAHTATSASASTAPHSQTCSDGGLHQAQRGCLHWSPAQGWHRLTLFLRTAHTAMSRRPIYVLHEGRKAVMFAVPKPIRQPLETPTHSDRALLADENLAWSNIHGRVHERVQKNPSSYFTTHRPQRGRPDRSLSHRLASTFPSLVTAYPSGMSLCLRLTN